MHHSYLFFFPEKVDLNYSSPDVEVLINFFRRQFVCKLFTFLTSSEPLLQNQIVVLLQFCQFQLILAQSIIRWREFKFNFQMKGHIFFSGKIIIVSRNTRPISTKLGSSILGWKELSSLYQVKGHTYIQGEIIAKILWQNLKIFFPKANLNQAWDKASLNEGDSRSLNEAKGYIFYKGR